MYDLLQKWIETRTKYKKYEFPSQCELCGYQYRKRKFIKVSISVLMYIHQLHCDSFDLKAVWWPKQYHNFQMDDYVAPTAEQKKQDNLAWKAPDFKQCHT